MKNRSVKGAIFDVDGTILNSMGTWCNVTSSFFSDMGVKLSDGDMIKFQKMSFEESLPIIQREYLPHISFEDMFRQFVERISYEYINNIPAKDGVCEYMHKLHSDGVKIGIATSGFKELCFAALKRIGVFDVIDSFTFSSETGKGKTEPDVYLLAAKRIGISPQECMVFEDILPGIISAKSAGFRTTAIADIANMHDTERLIQHSDHYITGWKELLSNI